jgi:tetratricopeptide (TPR) repeat protein
MRDSTTASLREQARAAAGQGDWDRAYELLCDADSEELLEGEDLTLLGSVAYASAHFDATIEAWERAHAEAIRAGDQMQAAAAAVRVAMHLLFDTALMAPVRGWLRRAEQLVAGQCETGVHAWLAVVRAYERLLSGDFVSAGQRARQAVEIGDRFDPAAAALGRVAEARSMILEGNPQQGLALLDEAAVSAVSGELDPITTGVVFCEVVCALQALAQYDRAEEWTAAMEQWHSGQPVGSIHGRCRVHRAEILRLRGACVEAEAEALRACDELRPYLRREFGWPLTELGRIRLRRGDIQGAKEALFAAHAVGWDPQPWLALVQLAEGEPALAADSIRNAVDHPLNIPSKEFPPRTELRRAPLLEAQVEIEIAGGDLDRATLAAHDLARVAELFESKALSASSTTARGRVRLARGDSASAIPAFEEAIRLWNEVGAPYEVAVSRMGLAAALRAAGREQQALMEIHAAQSSFEQVGALAHARQAAHVSEGGRPGAAGAASVPAGDAERAGEFVFHREGQYWSLTFDGRTVRVRNLKGLRYLALLLAQPGQEFHVLDLVTIESGGPTGPGADGAQGLSFRTRSDAGEMLDAQARAAYRRRLAEIDEDLEEARGSADAEREEQALAERDFLIRELARAFGLGTRSRVAGSTSERARAAVTRAIRQAIVRLHEHHPRLGEHLDQTIQTGTHCSYRPDHVAPIAWRL